MAQPHCHIAKGPGAASVTNQAQSDDTTKQRVQLTGQFTVAAWQINCPTVGRTVKLCGLCFDCFGNIADATRCCLSCYPRSAACSEPDCLDKINYHFLYFLSLSLFNSQLTLSPSLSSSSNNSAHYCVLLASLHTTAFSPWETEFMPTQCTPDRL